MQKGGSWKEFKIGDLFEIQKISNKLVGRNCIQSTGRIPVYSSDTRNNGIIGYSDLTPEFTVNEKNKMFLVFGDHTRTMNIVEQSFSVADNVKVLKPRYATRRVLLHICTVWLKGIRNLGYARHWNIAKDVQVKLPVTSDSQIDFDYMEKYISELEEERISELEEERISELAAYLKVTGLENCVLTKPEKLALKSRGDNLRKIKITNLFNIKNTHSILNSQIIPNSGVYPYVTAGESNNSIQTYINYDSTQLEDKNAILIGGKTTVITYQEKEFFSNDSHNLALYLKDSSNVSENVSLFLVASLNKALKPIYSWGNSISNRKIQKDYVSLPVTKTGLPDYEFMETYISALKKVVIKGVVDWKDRIIKTTRDIVYNK